MGKSIELHRLNHHLEAARRDRDRAEKQVRLARELVSNEIHHHQPDISQLDLSMTATEDLLARLSERIGEGRDLFCTVCRTPWPCQPVAVLRQAKAVLYGSSEDTMPPRGLLEKRPGLLV